MSVQYEIDNRFDDRTPPQDLAAEQSVLGAMILSRDSVIDVTHIIRGSDFYRPEHEQIFTVITDLHANGAPVDPILLANELERRGLLFRVGGHPYLHELISVAAVVNTSWHAEIIREKSIRREAMKVSTRIDQAARDPNLDVDDLRANMQRWLDEIVADKTTGTIDAAEAYRRAVELAEGGARNVIQSGFPDLDALLGGWWPGQLIVIGARPGVGKSIFMENTLGFAASLKRRCLLLSLEMSIPEIMQRTISRMTKVPLSALRRADLSNDQWDLVASVGAEISSLPITYLDQARVTIDQLRSEAWAVKQHARRAGEEMGLICVDYGQLMATKQGYQQTRQQALGGVTRGAKQLAKEIDCPLIMNAQLNRGPVLSNRPPQMSDIREAGDFEADADVVILLHAVLEENPITGDLEETGEIDVYVVKVRNGPTGHFRLTRYGSMARIGR